MVLHAEKKGTRELNNLFSFINYDAYSGNVVWDKVKGRVHLMNQ